MAMLVYRRVDSMIPPLSSNEGVQIYAHDGSMGRMVYLPIHEWLIFMVNVGKYTNPMDPLGYEKTYLHLVDYGKRR